jgi:hypothetical protein
VYSIDTGEYRPAADGCIKTTDLEGVLIRLGWSEDQTRQVSGGKVFEEHDPSSSSILAANWYMSGQNILRSASAEYDVFVMTNFCDNLLVSDRVSIIANVHK